MLSVSAFPLLDSYSFVLNFCCFCFCCCCSRRSFIFALKLFTAFLFKINKDVGLKFVELCVFVRACVYFWHWLWVYGFMLFIAHFPSPSSKFQRRFLCRGSVSICGIPAHFIQHHQNHRQKKRNSNIDDERSMLVVRLPFACANTHIKLIPYTSFSFGKSHFIDFSFSIFFTLSLSFAPAGWILILFLFRIAKWGPSIFGSSLYYMLASLASLAHIVNCLIILVVFSTHKL